MVRKSSCTCTHVSLQWFFVVMPIKKLGGSLQSFIWAWACDLTWPMGHWPTWCKQKLAKTLSAGACLLCCSGEHCDCHQMNINLDRFVGDLGPLIFVTPLAATIDWQPVATTRHWVRHWISPQPVPLLTLATEQAEPIPAEKLSHRDQPKSLIRGKITVVLSHSVSGRVCSLHSKN